SGRRRRTVRFGKLTAPNAHQAALQLSLLLDQDIRDAVFAARPFETRDAAESAAFIRFASDVLGPLDFDFVARYAEAVARHFGQLTPPDTRAVVAAVLLEAAKASQARKQLPRQFGQSGTGRQGVSADLETMREAIRKRGRDAKPEILIREAGINQQRGRAA